VAYVPLAAMMIVGGLAAPRILHTVRPKPLTLVGMLFLTAGVAWLSRITATSGYASGALLPLLLLGVGLGLTIMPLNSILLTDVQHAQTGAASALQQMMLRIGASIGLVIMVAAGTKHSPGPHKAALPTPAGVAHSVSRAFDWATVFILLALVISALLLRSRPAETTESAPLSGTASRRTPDPATKGS
jgi:MFS family permease